MTSPLLLVADVGGTNTRVGLAHGTSVDTASIRRYRNAEADGLPSVLRDYLSSTGARPDAAAAAAAGPLQNGGVRLTNLDWDVMPDGIASATGCSTVSVLNDLQAQGFSLPFLDAAHLTPVAPGQTAPDPMGTRLVIGIGTGLNAALVLRDDDEYPLVPPSETGHIDMPTPTPALRDLADWLTARHGFAAAEEALSGRGIVHLYQWASERAGASAPPDVTSQDVMRLLSDGDATARLAAESFSAVLGALAGSLALIQLPFGGIYLAGGMARALAPDLRALGFADAFAAKGRFSDYMAQFSVSVIEDDYAALTGCAAHLTDMMARA